MFTSHVRSLHQELASDIPIDVFAAVLEPKSVGLTERSQFYAPVQFAVQVCGEISAPAGAIKIAVPVHANPKWLDTLRQRFSGMVPQAAAGKVDFRTTTGQSIAEIPIDELASVGKLSLFVNDKKVRLPNMPTIPVEYSIAKMGKIETWMKDTLEDMPELIADELVGKDTKQVEAALRKGGSLQRLVEKRIQSSMNDWEEFIRVHHMNSPSEVGPTDAKAVLETISGEVLDMVRKYVAAAATPINAYIASIEITSGDLVLASKQAHFTGNGHELYQKLADDALATPAVRQKIVNTIYNRTWSVGCRWDAAVEKKQRDALKERRKEAAAAKPLYPVVAPPAEEGDEDAELDDTGLATGGAAKAKDVPASFVKLTIDDLLESLIVAKEGGPETFTDFLESSDFKNSLDTEKMGEILTRFGIDDPSWEKAITKRRESQIAIFKAILRKEANFEQIKSSIEAHHPWYAAVHHTIQPMAGAYPTYYTVGHTKQDMTKNAKYAGNLDKTYKAYHMFAGVPISPPGVTLGARKASSSNTAAVVDARMVPLIGCSHKSKRYSSGSSSESETDDDDDEPIFSSIAACPGIIPIRNNSTAVREFPALPLCEDIFDE